MIVIDEELGHVLVDEGGEQKKYSLNSSEAFKVVSNAWLRAGWNTKYVYSFSWLGRPIIQLPEDMIRMQEVISHVRPTKIVETGVAHGGSLIFYASLLKAMDIQGKVIGVDIDIRQHNRRAIEEHNLFGSIELIEGSSIDAAVIDRVSEHISAEDVVLVILDSCHSKAHVLSELEAYGPLVTEGSYIVATDGIMGAVAGQERAEADWTWNNPEQAAITFADGHDEFKIVEPEFPFNEGIIRDRVTYWPNCFLLKQSSGDN